jgi:hypothetical protein
VKRFGLFVLGVLSFAAIAGCSKSPTINIPPPPPARVFVADLNNGLVVFSQPVTSASTPSFTIPGASTAGVVFDSAGNLYVSNSSALTISVYARGVTATSVPTLVIGPITGAFSPEGMAFDHSGNLWVADESGTQVMEFTPPFAAGVQAPAKAITGLPFGPVGVTFDLAGDMLVPSFGSKTVTVFRPPFVNGPNPVAATMTMPNNTGGIGMDTHDNLIVGQEDGTLAIVHPPFATGVTPSAFVPTTFLNGNPLFPAIEALNSGTDAAGDLWIPYGGDGGGAPPPPIGGANEFGLAEFVPPFGGGSVSNIGLLQAGLSFPFSVAIGQ